MLINIKGIKGEQSTGFETRVVNGVDKGPFECGNCEYFEDDACAQKDMIERAKAAGIPLTKDGHRPVGDKDCCEFVDRVGKERKRSGGFNVEHATWLKK